MPGGVAGLSIEHAASLQCLERLDAAILPVDAAGLALPPDAALIPQGGIVATMLVNNEVGTIQPVADFAAAAHAKDSLLLCDAVQGFGRIAIPEGPDLIAVSAHKIHGPKGIGALWIRDGVDLPPLMLGGAQEQGLRSGTVSPALCAGFGAAAALEVSHVLRAMGMSEADARASIRLGWGRYTSEQALRDGLNAIKDAVRLQGVN